MSACLDHVHGLEQGRDAVLALSTTGTRGRHRIGLKESWWLWGRVDEVLSVTL